MISLSVHLRKLLVIVFVLIGSIHLTNIYGQSLDFKTTVDSVKINNTYLYTISIEIIEGTPDFKTFIYDGFPGKNGNVIATGIKINERKFKFSNITLTSYYIGILDKNYKFVCRSNIQTKSLQ